MWRSSSMLGAVVLVAALLCVGAASVQGQAPVDRVTLTFTNADVSEVISAISAITRQNIVVSGTAKEKVTVRLVGSTVEDALRTVASLAGLSYKRIGDMFVVASADDLKKLCFQAGYVATYTPAGLSLDDAKRIVEGSFPYVSVQTLQEPKKVTLTGVVGDVRAALETLKRADYPAAPPPPPPTATETIAPKSIGVNALASAVSGAYPDLKVEVHGAALVIAGPAPDVAKAKAFAQSLDVPAAKDMVTKVVRLEYIGAEAAAEMLSKALPDLIAVPGPAYYAPRQAEFQPLSTESRTIFAAAGGGGGTGTYGGGMGGMEDESKRKQTRTRIIVLSGAAEQVEAAVELLKATDVAPDQVMIEAKVLDLSDDVARDIGIDWSWTAFTSTGQVDVTNKRETSTPPAAKPSDRIVTRKVAIGPTELVAKLDLMITSGKAKILANPKIAVLDSEDANIFIGDLLRYTILRQVNPITGNIFDVETVPVGIALLVRPRVNAGGDITMKIHPVVSTVTDFVNGIPQTSSREADSTIRVKSGQTVVIGGLLREDEIKNLKYIPGLSSLPIIGELFKHRSTSRRHSEVVIFITPRLMQAGQP